MKSASAENPKITASNKFDIGAAFNTFMKGIGLSPQDTGRAGAASFCALSGKQLPTP